MMHTEGEYAGSRAAGRAGIPFSLSAMGTASIEDVKIANPHGRNWFQLYMWKDRERSMALVDRAAKAGYDTLLVTVDVPVAGARLRDKRNGMSIPPALTAKTVLNALPRPHWWIDFLTTEPLAFASLDRWSGTVAELLDTMFDPTVTFGDLAWIKSQWPGKVVVKGIQTVDDAVAVTELGVDGIVLSNHGGRQLDRAPIPFHLLPDVAREVGEHSEIILDTGITSGADIVAAVALGARFTLIGRAYLYGLMAGGEAGVDRAIAILSEQIERTMRLLGVASLGELTPATSSSSNGWCPGHADRSRRPWGWSGPMKAWERACVTSPPPRRCRWAPCPTCSTPPTRWRRRRSRGFSRPSRSWGSCATTPRGGCAPGGPAAWVWWCSTSATRSSPTSPAPQRSGQATMT